MLPVMPSLAARMVCVISRAARLERSQRQHPLERHQKASQLVRLSPPRQLEGPKATGDLRIRLHGGKGVARAYGDHAALQFVGEVLAVLVGEQLIAIHEQQKRRWRLSDLGGVEKFEAMSL